MISFVGRLGPSKSRRVIQASVGRGVSLSHKTLNLPFTKNFVSTSFKCKDSSSPRMMDKSGKLPRFDPAADIPMGYGFIFLAGFVVLWGAAYFFANPFARSNSDITSDQKWVDKEEKESDANTLD